MCSKLLFNVVQIYYAVDLYSLYESILYQMVYSFDFPKFYVEKFLKSDLNVTPSTYLYDNIRKLTELFLI